MGLLEERFIPQAYDPKNEGLNNPDEAYKLYYFIDGNAISFKSYEVKCHA